MCSIGPYSCFKALNHQFKHCLYKDSQFQIRPYRLVLDANPLLRKSSLDSCFLISSMMQLANFILVLLNNRTFAFTFQLAVVADDSFYANRRDAALVECWKHGSVTDFSVLMNGGVVRASTTPITSVLLDHCKQESVFPGLHISLSEGEPLSAKGSVSSLLEDATGLFYGKVDLRKNLQTVYLRHVEIEIERQIIAFEKLFDAPPLRADGHQRCHVLPAEPPMHFYREVSNQATAARAVSVCGIEMAEQILTPFTVQLCIIVGHTLTLPTVQFYYVNKKITRSTDAFIGMLTMGQNMTIDNLEVCFSAIDRHATVELMTHPGYPLWGSDWSTEGCSAIIGPDDFCAQLTGVTK
ncbi:Carbohydrate deacetylase [Taenia solium]|eukprot:TsM_000438400 transcript=TsM_000438400 gene=TsM_000438400